MRNNISLDERKAIALEIMKYIHKVCSENNLTYSLYGGSALGAVRHKGFIPWDDDIDIILPHKDYKKLISILKKQNEYTLITPYEKESDFSLFFCKLCDKRTIAEINNHKKIEGLGVWVDIFPLNNLCNSYKDSLKFVKKCKKNYMTVNRYSMLKKYYYSNTRIKSIIKAVVYFPGKIWYNLQSKKYKSNAIRYMEINNNVETEYVGCNSMDGTKDIFKKTLFDKYRKIKFENTYFNIIAQYDSYLTARYGDYMKLPPKNDRTQHTGIYYWKDEK